MSENSTISFSLSAVETLKAVDIFAPGNVDKLLEGIESEVRSLVFDVSTLTGRKEIASMAYKVSRSKIILDATGKDLVHEWKKQAKAVDRERKQVRDRLDALRDEVREPLTIWEEKKKAAEEKERLENEIALAHDRALLENQIFDNQRAEQERIKNEKEEAEELAKIAHEETIKREAATRARLEERQRQESDEAARVAREEKIRKDAEDRIIKAKVAARESELRMVRELKEQEERIRFELQAKEDAKREEDAQSRAEAQRKSEDKEHRRKINTRILGEFIRAGMDESVARTVIRMVASGNIDNMRILY